MEYDCGRAKSFSVENFSSRGSMSTDFECIYPEAKQCDEEYREEYK